MRNPHEVKALNFRSGLLILVFCISTTAHAGVLGKWSFDEGDGQIAGNSVTKELAGAITGATWADGESGKALEFSGPNYDGPYKPPGTFVKVDGSEKSNPTKTVTVSVSVYPTMKPVAWGGIVEKGVGYGSSFRLVMLRSGKVRGAIGNQHVTVDSPDELPLNVWTKLQLVYDGKTLTLLVNGKKVAAEAATAMTLASDYPIEFGRRFTGRIDDVAITY